jgi:hypothetical protein
MPRLVRALAEVEILGKLWDIPSFKSLFSCSCLILLKLTIKYQQLTMSGPGAGFEYPPVEVTWLKRDVLLFANSIGCTADELHFLFVLLPVSFISKSC